MRNSQKDLSVFDFKSDEANEARDKKLTNCHFLEFFVSNCHNSKQPESSTPPSIDLHEVDSSESSPPPIDLHEVESPERSTPARNVASSENKFVFDDAKACSASNYKHAIVCHGDFRHGSPIQDHAIHDSGVSVTSTCDDEDSETQSSEVPESLMSDQEERCTSVFGASSTSDDFHECEGPSEGTALELCLSSCGKMDDNKNAVIICPDYVNYKNTLFLESQLTFCSDCIKVECSDSNGSDEKLNLVCDVVDIIRIGCHWSTSAEAVMFKFWIRTNKEHHCIEKFMASIADVLWLEKEKKIKALAQQYETIWDTLFDNTYDSDDDIFRTHIPFSKRYFSEIKEPFEDVIYPKGDPDAISISKRDIELLEPDTFINDTIIDFYIKYLQNKVETNEKNRFHFFNSFFFRKLADLDKDPQSISEGRAAFQRVRKWTRKLNIFEKDYLFIPVNFNLHWSLLVICHSGEINTFSDDDLKNSAKVPCILHMDSIKGSHSGLKDLIQSYLLEEWKGRHPELPDDYTSKFSNLRFVSLELPQQGNASDCGLFLLHYVELFLKEAPICFNPIKISRLSNFLSADWFPPAEASFKRFDIRWLLYELFRNSSEKLTPSCFNGDLPCSGDDVDQAGEFVFAESSPSMIINGPISTAFCAAQDDDTLKQVADLVSIPMPYVMEECADVKADATDHLNVEWNGDSLKQQVAVIKDQNGCQPLIVSPASQTCSTSGRIINISSCELSSASEKKKLAVAITLLSRRSIDQLTILNEEGESQKLASIAVDCDFVSNSHNNSDDCSIKFGRHDKPQGACVAADHNSNDEKHFEISTEGEEKMHEVRCDNFEALETENGRTGYCTESYLTTDECCVAENGELTENLYDGDAEMSTPENTEVVAEIQEINAKESIKEKCDACRESMHCNDSTMIEIITLDNDVPVKGRFLESMVPNSKRLRVAPQEKRRVTRSCSKACSP